MYLQLKVVKPFIFMICLIPFLLYVYWFIVEGLGANPIEALTRSMGDWTLRLLLITLSVSPFVRLTGWKFLIQFRRMLGLFVFFYVCVHFFLLVVTRF